MKREIITIDEYGRLNMSTDTTVIWMTEAEIVELFGTTVGVVSSAIKASIKSDALHDYEVCKCIRLDGGNSADVYNMEVVVALAFHIRSQGATRFRKHILRTLGAMNKQPAINILMTYTLETEGSSIQLIN